MSEEPKKHEIAGIPVCAPKEHDWRPVSSPHPSVTGQLYECSKCKHVTSAPA